MDKYKILKIFLPFLFLLAVALGLTYLKFTPYLGSNRQSYKVQHLPASGDKSLADFYKQSRELAREKEQKSTASFLAVGDIMLSRSVATTIKNSGDPLLPFSQMADIFESVNFTFGNLESPISGSEKFNGTGSMVFNAPASYTKGLAKYNFKILNLANNHAFDQGLLGLKNTVKFLDGQNIKHIGVGTNQDEAWQPAIVEANGIKICFVGASYASVNDNGKTTNNYVARIEDLANLKSKIQNLKSFCDFTVATMHAGTEYTRAPNATQIAFAHAAIDDGADMVIGAHPHWAQNVEKYCPAQSSPPVEDPDRSVGAKEEYPATAGEGGKINTASTSPYATQKPLNTLSVSSDSTSPPSAVAKAMADKKGENNNELRSITCPNPKYIFYSLGNFIFDQMWSQDTREGLAIKIRISKSEIRNTAAPNAATLNDLQGPRQGAKLEQIELIPVIIENYSTPRPATALETKKILEKIGENDKILTP